MVDDEVFVQTTLKSALAAHNIEVLAAVDSAASALKAARELNPDVVLLDLDLGPGPSGIDIAIAIRKEFPVMGLVMLTSYTDPRFSMPDAPLLPDGCRFLTKSRLSDFAHLVTEILTAKHKPLQKIQRGKEATLLSDAQLDVLRMISLGLSTAQIADERGVTEKAIESMISKTYSILGLEKSKSLNQRVQLARKYFSLSGKKPPGA